MMALRSPALAIWMIGYSLLRRVYAEAG